MVVFYFFATPLVDYSKIIEEQANTETASMQAYMHGKH